MFNRIEIFSFLLTLIIVVSEISGFNNCSYHETGNRGKTIERQRRTISSIQSELGAKHARFYRMDISLFYYLVELLTPNIRKSNKKRADSCGRWLLRTPHAGDRLRAVMETMARLRRARNMDERSCALLDSAFCVVEPPTDDAAGRQRKRAPPPTEAYLKDLLCARLAPDAKTVGLVAKQLQRLPWYDVAVALRRAKPEVAARLNAAALEETRRFLENPTFRDQQRLLVTARLLGELHNRVLVPTSVIFEQLYEFVNFGHDVPDALKEASERQLKMEEEEEERRSEREKAVQNKDKDEGDHRNNSIALLK